MPRLIRIALVGDSSVADNPPDVFQRGWGQMLRLCFTRESVEVFNFARNGRSSKSFITEGLWTQVLAMNPRPDVVLIHIGANDIPGKRIERETLPGVVPAVLPASGLGASPLDWYRLNLKRFIDGSRTMGARAVLATQMERHEFESFSATPICRNKLYAQAVREVARELETPLIDLQAYSLELFTRYGVLGTQTMHHVRPDGEIDHSHFNPFGASIYAERVAGELIALFPELAAADCRPTPGGESRLVADHSVTEAVVGKA